MLITKARWAAQQLDIIGDILYPETGYPARSSYDDMAVPVRAGPGSSWR